MKRSGVTPKSEDNLYRHIRELVIAARQTVARGVDLVQVRTNFEIGRHIVDHEQQGEHRAAYGREVIKQLAERLASEFGDGFSARNLASMRTFFLCYSDRCPNLQTLSAKSPAPATSIDLVEFDGIKKVACLNSFSLTPKQWIERTGEIGIISKAGRYGGTYAHKDIAFEFAAWVSVELRQLNQIVIGQLRILADAGNLPALAAGKADEMR